MMILKKPKTGKILLSLIRLRRSVSKFLKELDDREIKNRCLGRSRHDCLLKEVQKCGATGNIMSVSHSIEKNDTE